MHVHVWLLWVWFIFRRFSESGGKGEVFVEIVL